jgi:hypothetical protein
MEQQTTLGQLAQTIMELAAADPALQAAGMFFDAENDDQRRDLVHAVRFLMDTGVLRKLAGDERDVLYDINRHILAAILQVSDDPIPFTEDGRRQWIRSRLVRSLLDDPILYFHSLNDEARTYLEKHRSDLFREIYQATGLIAEIRREGIAMVDDAGDLADLKLEEAPLSLQLVQWFAECLKNHDGAAIPVSAVEDRVRELGAEERLTEEALSRLRALRLIQITESGVVPLAASGRYAAIK